MIYSAISIEAVPICEWHRTQAMTKATLVQVMAWCRQVASHYLNKYWPSPTTPNSATRGYAFRMVCLFYESKSRTYDIQVFHSSRNNCVAMGYSSWFRSVHWPGARVLHDDQCTWFIPTCFWCIIYIVYSYNAWDQGKLTLQEKTQYKRFTRLSTMCAPNLQQTLWNSLWIIAFQLYFR